MSNGQGLRSNEIGPYAFGNTAAMEGFNPDATGYRDAPPGRHLMEVADYELHQNQEFRGARPDPNTYILHQLRVRLVIPAGALAGASALDFLPAPPQAGQVWPVLQANRWANFVRSLGFALPKGQTVPAEMLAEAQAGRNPFDLLKGRRCYTTTAYKLDRDTKQPQLKDDGLPRVEVKFFGYEPVGADGSPALGAAPLGPQAAAQAPVQVPAPAAAGATFEL